MEPDATRNVLTSDNGSFTLDMPTGATAPDTGLTLTVHGANSNTTVTIPVAQIAANGMVGALTLAHTAFPFAG